MMVDVLTDLTYMIYGVDRIRRERNINFLICAGKIVRQQCQNLMEHIVVVEISMKTKKRFYSHFRGVIRDEQLTSTAPSRCLYWLA